MYASPKLLDRMFADLHEMHKGMEKIQSQAREAVHWPDIDIIDYNITNPISKTEKLCMYPDKLFDVNTSNASSGLKENVIFTSFVGIISMKMRDGGLRCFLYLSPKFLPVSPMYYMVQPHWSHLYIAPVFLQMLSLSLGATNNSLTVLAPLK